MTEGRVLVADDDAGIRQSTVEILRGMGYSVSAAQDGEEALTELAVGDIEAIVLDVRMPRRDGISVIEEMDPPPPPPGVLLVSAYDIERETRSQLGRRVYRVLRKPVSPPVLIAAVEEAVELARSIPRP